MLLKWIFWRAFCNGLTHTYPLNYWWMESNNRTASNNNFYYLLLLLPFSLLFWKHTKNSSTVKNHCLSSDKTTQHRNSSRPASVPRSSLYYSRPSRRVYGYVYWSNWHDKLSAKVSAVDRKRINIIIYILKSLLPKAPFLFKNNCGHSTNVHLICNIIKSIKYKVRIPPTKRHI